MKGCGKMKKNILIIIGSVLISALIGVIISVGYSAVHHVQHTYDPDLKNTDQEHDFGIDNGFKMVLDSLEEEMWFVDAVIYGTVLEQGLTYQQNTNINSKIDFNFPVTPSTILVKEVVYGKVNGDKITLLQHGSNLEHSSANEFVREGEDYMLFLMKTTWGDYWPYDVPQKAIWKVADGFVSDTATDVNFTHLNNTQIEEFMKVIKKAGQNKKKPDWAVE